MAQDTSGGATPSTPTPMTPIQKALQWFEITRGLTLAFITLLGAYGQLVVTSAQRDYRVQTLESRVSALEKWQDREEQREQDKAEKLTRALTLLEALGQASRRQP